MNAINMGKADTSRALLRPIQFESHPKKKFPERPPTQIIAPIQDASSLVIGPLVIGLSSL